MRLSFSLKKSGLFVIVFFAFLSVNATNYYVNATSGSNSFSGLSTTAAKATIQAASNLTNPGDTVFIMNGTYISTSSSSQDIVRISRSGTEGRYITYKAYPGHKPKIQHSINVTWQVWTAIAVSASYIIIDGLEVEGNNGSLDYAGAYQSWQDYENNIKDFVKIAKYNAGGIDVGKYNAVHHVIVRNCKLHDSGGNGGTKCDYFTFENNIVYNNCWYSMYAGSGFSILGPISIDTTTGYKIFIRNNIVYNNKCLVPWEKIDALSDGNGIILDINNGTQFGATFTYSGRYLVSNNISYNNGGGGIHAYLADHIDIINNVAFNNGTVVGYPEMDANQANDVKFYNNIMYARPGARCNGNDDGIYDYNLYFNGLVSNGGSNSVIANPQFVNLTIDSTDNPTANFQLKNISPAINGGSNVPGQFIATDFLGVARPFGSRPDIGVYEFTGVPITNNFAAGNLAVLRVGDGTTTLSTNTIDANLVEYNTSGTATGYNVVLGNAATVSPNKILLSGANNTGEGQLNLSTDGKYLTVPGYDANVGDLQTTYQTNNKVIAVIGYNGIPDYSTRITGATLNRLVRSAATATNNRIYIAGTSASPASSNSTRFLPFGTPATTNSTAFNGAVRSIKMFNSQLYFANNNTVGSLTPNPASGNFATSVAFPGVTVSGHNYTSFFLLDVDASASYLTTGYDVLYCADASLGLVKFYWNGSTWVFSGAFNPTSITSVTGGLQDITARLNGSGNPEIFVVKGAASNNNIIALTDASGLTGNISTVVPFVTNLSSAGANYMFRGIAFTPSQFSILPVDILSFSAVLNNNQVQLKWVTSYEANAASFIIERSSNGINFSEIGKVAASNNIQGSAYEFVDNNLANGQALYRLKAVDKDGATKYSNVIAINNKLAVASSLLIYPNPAVNFVTVTYPIANSDATLSIYQMSGKKVVDMVVAKGSTQRSVDVSNLTHGFYKIVYHNNNQIINGSFVK